MSGEYRRYQQSGNNWLSNFTSTLCALLVASAIVGVSLRAYLRWSVSEAVEGVKEKQRLRQ